MPAGSKNNLYLGLFTLSFALILLTVWIPMDTQTGLIEKVRRQVTIGDALAPTVAGLFLIVGGLLLILTERNAPGQSTSSMSGLIFASAAIFIIAASLIVMRWTGPLAVWMANALQGGDLEYRLLRDNAPWKYLGFLLGGTMMITGLVGLVEGQLRLRAILIAVAAVIAMIFVYDVPFDDLLLPPNGDV